MAPDTAASAVDAAIFDMTTRGYVVEPHDEIDVADAITAAALEPCTTDEQRVMVLISHGFWVIKPGDDDA